MGRIAAVDLIAADSPVGGEPEGAPKGSSPQRTPRRWRHWDRWDLLVWLTLLVGAIIYLAQNYGHGPLAAADGRYYYIYLRSLLMDHDINLTNDYLLLTPDFAFKNYYGFGVTRTGYAANPFGIGPAIFWLPLFLLAHGIAWLRHLMGASAEVLDPLSHAHQAIALFGSYLGGCAAVWFTYRAARRKWGPAESFLGTLTFLASSPLLLYSIWVPSYAHALGAGACAATLWYWLGTRDRSDGRRFMWLGFLCGAAGLARPQMLLVLILPAADTLGTLAKNRRKGIRALAATARSGAICLGAAAIVFSPQLIAWRCIYGTWTVAPQGPGFMRWTESLWAETLFSPRNGFFPYTPLALLGLAGLVGLAWKSREGAPLLALFIGCAITNGAVWDWWGGGSFGARRYTEVCPMLAFGFVALLHVIHDWLKARPTLSPLLILAGLSIPFVVINGTHLDFWQGPGDGWNATLATRARYKGTFGHALDRIFDAVGNPIELPASAALAARFGVPLSRYDEVSGRYLLGTHFSGANPAKPQHTSDSIDFGTAGGWIYLGRGWRALPDPHAPKAAGLIGTQGVVMVPLLDEVPIRLRLSVRAHAATQAALRVNKSFPFPFQATDTWRDVALDVDQRNWIRGVNEVEFSSATGGVLELRSIGLTRR